MSDLIGNKYGGHAVQTVAIRASGRKISKKYLWPLDVGLLLFRDIVTQAPEGVSAGLIASRLQNGVRELSKLLAPPAACGVGTYARTKSRQELSNRVRRSNILAAERKAAKAAQRAGHKQL